MSDVRVTSETQGQATVVPALANSIGPGEHTTTITIRACLGSPNCSSGEITGSPRTIAVKYTVPSNLQGDTVSVDEVETGDGFVLRDGR